MEQQIRFCTSADGTRIAYATAGQGPPLLFSTGWMAAALESRPQLADALGPHRLVVTCDQRGLGDSQREVDNISLETQLADLDSVVTNLHLEKFDLVGFVDAAVVCAVYASRYPRRVSKLILSTVYSRGADLNTPEALRAFADLCRNNWQVAKRTLASVVAPGGTAESVRLLRDSIGRTMSGEVAAKYIEFVASVDIRPTLAQICAPTLVLHGRGDKVVPFTAGKAAAALIPNAAFVAVDGTAYYSAQVTELIRRFLDGDEGPSRSGERPPSALVTILFTDMEGSTALTQRLGDAKAQEVLRAHNALIRDALKAHDGSEVKHTGDGIMASFGSAAKALQCAVAIQRGFAERNDGSETAVRVRIGVNAGEPVAEEGDLFGSTVQLAARVCAKAEPGQILAANVVRELSTGKGFLFSDIGDVALKGFEDSVRLYEVRWEE